MPDGGNRLPHHLRCGIPEQPKQILAEQGIVERAQGGGEQFPAGNGMFILTVQETFDHLAGDQRFLVAGCIAGNTAQGGGLEIKIVTLQILPEQFAALIRIAEIDIVHGLDAHLRIFVAEEETDLFPQAPLTLVAQHPQGPAAHFPVGMFQQRLHYRDELLVLHFRQHAQGVIDLAGIVAVQCLDQVVHGRGVGDLEGELGGIDFTLVERLTEGIDILFADKQHQHHPEQHDPDHHHADLADRQDDHRGKDVEDAPRQPAKPAVDQHVDKDLDSFLHVKGDGEKQQFTAGFVDGIFEHVAGTAQDHPAGQTRSYRHAHRRQQLADRQEHDGPADPEHLEDAVAQEKLHQEAEQAHPAIIFAEEGGELLFIRLQRSGRREGDFCNRL